MIHHEDLWPKENTVGEIVDMRKPKMILSWLHNQQALVTRAQCSLREPTHDSSTSLGIARMTANRANFGKNPNSLKEKTNHEN
jgi:hypothetical protein